MFWPYLTGQMLKVWESDEGDHEALEGPAVAGNTTKMLA